MKLRAVLIFTGLIFCVTCVAAPPKTKEEFIAAVRAAFVAKDVKKIHELSWEKGMSDFDMQQVDQVLPMMVQQLNGGETYSLEPKETESDSPQIMMGRRLEPTHEIDGMVKIAQKSADGSSSSSMSLPYALIDGSYYIVSTKSTDLNWKGPPDKTLVVNVTGDGQDKVKTHIKYNVSGLDLEHDQKYASDILSGQYISEVTVTSDSDDVNVVLDLRDEDGNSYYQSAPLKGKGEIHYHKGDKGAADK